MANRRPTAVALTQSQPVPVGQAGVSIGTLGTRDPNLGDTFTYTVHDSRFQVVDGDDLVLAPGVFLPWTTGNKLRLSVTSTDQGGLSVTKTLSVQVLPNQRPTDITLAQTAVPSGVAGATVGTLGTVDPDVGGSFSYGVSDARFQIVNGNELALKPGIALDFNTTPTVRVSVTSTDAGGLSLTKWLTVAVGGLKYQADVYQYGPNDGSFGMTPIPMIAEWSSSRVLGAPTLQGTRLRDDVAISATAIGAAGAYGGYSESPGAPGGLGGSGTARILDTIFNLGAGTNYLTLSASGTGGPGGRGGDGATGPSGGRGGDGGDGGDGVAALARLTVQSTGALEAHMSADARLDYRWQGGPFGYAPNGGAGGQGGFFTDHAQGLGGAGGDGGDAGDVLASITSIFIDAGRSTGPVQSSFVVTARGEAGGLAGRGSDWVLAHINTPSIRPGPWGDTGDGLLSEASFSANTIATGRGNDVTSISLTAQASGGGTDGVARVSIVGNTLAMGAGNDALRLSVRVETPYQSPFTWSNATLSLSDTNFTFSGNSFDGGTGTNTLDLSGIQGAGATIDLAARKLFIADSPANVLRNFNVVIGTGAADSVIDGKGNHTYNGSGGADRFTFTRGHGIDIIQDFSTDDVLILKNFGSRLNSFREVLAQATDIGGGLRIDTLDGGTIDLQGFFKASLTAENVLFA